MAAKRHIEFTFIEQPDPFAGMSETSRAEASKKLGDKAQQLFLINFTEIDGIIHSVNPLQLLAHFAFYDQLWLDGKGSSYGYTPTQQSAVEWLQALILRIPEEQIQVVLNEPPTGAVLLRANVLLNETQQAYGMMRIGAKETSPVALVSEMVRQQTAFVRNEGYPSQTRRLLAGLTKPLDAMFERVEGFSLSHVIEGLYALGKLVQDRLNEDKLRRRRIFTCRSRSDMIDAFAQLNGLSKDRVVSNLAPANGDLDSLKAELMTWMDTVNFRLFFFDVEIFSSLLPAGLPKIAAKAILEKLSIEFGKLAAHNPEHLILENPIWTRPIIHLGEGRYYFPFVSLVQSFGLEMIERFIDPKYTPAHPTLWSRYCNKVRGDYLEVRTFEILCNAMPDAKIYRGLKWRDEEAQIDGENDVLVLLDTQAIVLECKSGRLRALAARGEPKSLSGDIEKLMSDPAAQAGRFARYLLRQKGVIKLKDHDGVGQEIDLTQLNHVTTVGIILDYVGTVSTQQRLLRKANLLKPDAVPSANIPLHDLECVLELLDRPAMIFHYLRRRSEMEATTEIISEESGLLALYLATGFDIGEMEGANGNRFALPSLGKQLEPYFMGKETGNSAPKPQMKLRGWWRDLLNTFEERKFPGWLEASAILLGTHHNGQAVFEKACIKLRRNVRSNWHELHDDACIWAFGPKHDRKALVCLAIKNKDQVSARETLSLRMQHAAAEHGAQRVLGLILSAEKNDHPYLGVYFHQH